MRYVLISFVALLVMAAPVLADDGLGGQTSAAKPVMEKIFFLGKGIASVPSDPANFKIVRVAAARVRVYPNGTETVVSAGIMYLDDQKYILRSIVSENGSATADIYLNETKAGSISVQSVVKGGTEIWAGTMAVDGTAYNVHILDLPRKIKPLELREKVKDYCQSNADANCSQKVEDFCQSNPTNVRCLALFKAHCMKGNNMDDSRCREFMKGWCQNNSEEDGCRLYAVQRTAAYCAGHPGTPTCVSIEKRLVDFCETDPGNEKCADFCRKYPGKCMNIVRNLAEFCLENSNHSDCVQYCRQNPKSCMRLSSTLVSLCEKEPNREECREYCKAHPVMCKVVTADLAKFCLSNHNETKCQNYCKNYPDACRKVTAKIEGYCTANSDKPACQAFCQKNPARCSVPQPLEAEVEDTEEGGA